MVEAEEESFIPDGDIELGNASEDSPAFSSYFFDIYFDEEIPEEILCKAVDSIEVNSEFLDEELICPDQRTERFDIYATRVGPDDLEDCD